MVLRIPLRTRNAALLAKIETTEGEDASPVAGTDAVLVENPQISFNPNIVQTNEATGSLDGRGPITGGMTVQVTGDVYLKSATGACTSVAQTGNPVWTVGNEVAPVNFTEGQLEIR